MHLKNYRLMIGAAALLAVLAVPVALPAQTATPTAAPQAARPVFTNREELVAEIARRFDDERLSHAHIGVKIQSLDSGDIWYERNANKLFMPASNEKILTTAASLMFLGPDFRFTTTVGHTGSATEGTLNGDLVVKGDGDPTLYSRFYKEPQEVWRGWAKQLKEKGITRIAGDIVGDDNAWADEHIGNGWPADDLSPWYYAEFGPLTFNENYVDIKITPPATVDGEVKLEPNVKSSYYTLKNEIRVVPEGEGRNNVTLSRPFGSNVITLGGTVVAGSKSLEETPTITNPTLWYVTALKETLEAEGIQVDGKPVDIDDPNRVATTQEPEVLIEHQSPPLREILAALMSRSQNMYAETMVYTMGWKDQGKGTFPAGRAVVRRELEKFGVAPNSFVFSDGSGLSRYNYVSPETIVNIYTGLLQSEYGEIWRETQAVAGKSGTLRNRMKDTPAADNMRGKTGLISNVRALSGFVKTAGGETVVFSFLTNAHLLGSSELDNLYDGVVVMLAEYGVEEK